MTESKRGECRVCHKIVQVTVDGKIRKHGYARGGSDPSVRCIGSDQPPVEDPHTVKCFACLNREPAKSLCEVCDTTGEVSTDRVADLDSVIVVERALSGLVQEPTFLAATAVQALLSYGFLKDVEEVPTPELPPINDARQAEADLLAVLMEFYDEWKGMLRGPVKPRIVELKDRVEAAFEAFRSKGQGDGKQELDTAGMR